MPDVLGFKCGSCVLPFPRSPYKKSIHLWFPFPFISFVFHIVQVFLHYFMSLPSLKRAFPRQNTRCIYLDHSHYNGSLIEGFWVHFLFLVFWSFIFYIGFLMASLDMLTMHAWQLSFCCTYIFFSIIIIIHALELVEVD